MNKKHIEIAKRYYFNIALDDIHKAQSVPGAMEATAKEGSLALAEEGDKYVEIEAGINGLPVRVADNFLDFVDFDINKCLMTAEPEYAEQFEKELQEKYGHVASIYRSEPYFIEIMPKNVDKATSLDKMLPAIGVRREETVCCGDGFNDISMIRYAGVGVAMANAQEVVKEAADYITASNDEDGLVQVINEFF